MAMGRSSTSSRTRLWAISPPSRWRARPAASSAKGRSTSRGGLPQRIRRLLRQPVRRHRVSRQLRGVPAHRRVCAGRIAVWPLLVVVQQRLRRLAGGGRSLRRPMGDPDVDARPRRGQLLRRRHRLHRGAGGQPAARNSRLLSYAGWGHTAYGRNDCTTAHIDAYLVGGTLPRAGTVCPANPNPFLSAAGRPRSAERPHRRGAARAGSCDPSRRHHPAAAA